MFARAIVTRTSLRFAPTTCSRRAYASAAANEPKKSSALVYSAIAGIAAAAAGGAGYYYYCPTVDEKDEVALKGDGEWVDLKLADVKSVAADTKKFRFELPSKDHVSGLKVASAVLVKYQAPTDEKPTIRPYTPINDEDARGYLDLLVKRYDNGRMSKHLHSMAINQSLSFKGPVPKYEWTPNKHEHIGLIAGGTGITPMYQLLRAIFNNPEDKTKATLFFANISEEDILLREELDGLRRAYPHRFKVYYLAEDAPKWSSRAFRGRVTGSFLSIAFPEPGSGNNKIFVCGPPGMYKAVCGAKNSPSDQGEVKGILKELGYKKEEVYKF